VLLKKKGRKEAREDLQLEGQSKIPSLVTLGMNLMFGDQWGSIFVWW
jgi:hypothetical protein